MEATVPGREVVAYGGAEDDLVMVLVFRDEVDRFLLYSTRRKRTSFTQGMEKKLMNYTKYLKGSEWRKWDLHIHAPTSALSNRFEGVTEDEKWGWYINKLNSLTDIAVLGITDYFSIDGYKEVMEFKNEGILDNIHCILPNIELRILPVTDQNRPINLHLIIDPKIADRIDSLLFNNLEYEYGDTTYKCTKDDLILLGRTYDSSLTDDRSAYMEGVNQFKVTLNQVKAARDKNADLKNYSVLVVSNSNNDGNSGRQHSSLATTRQEIYRQSHFIFSGNPQDREYFLGKKASDPPEQIIEKYGGLMPCIHGSDAHSLSKICKPDQNRFTWIKADPTFEGLKQLVHEPESRVRIQPDIPEKKTPYNIIDAVRFVDSRGEKEFSDDWIELNSNLNSIIGGKSSGKSLLLYHIAKTIDADRINNINNEKGTYPNLSYSFEKNVEFDFEVKWADGETYKLKDEKKPNRPITYIPQLYLNRLAEDRKDELNSLIDNMLIESSPDYEEFRDRTKQELSDITTEMFEVIDDYYKVRDSLNEKKQELRALGDKDAVIENHKLIAERIEILRQESRFSPEDEGRYKELTEKIEFLKQSSSEKRTLIQILTKTKEAYETFKQNIQSNLNESIFETVNSQFPALSQQDIQRVISDIINQTATKLQTALADEINRHFSRIDDEQTQLDTIQKNIESSETDLKPLSEKIRSKDAFSQLQEESQREEKKIKAFNDKQAEIDKLNGLLSTEPIKGKYSELFGRYQNIVEENRKYASVSDTDNLTLNSTIQINKEKFAENFIHKINKQKSLNQQFGDFFDAENRYKYDQDTHLDNTSKMIDTIVSGTIKFNAGFDEKHTMLSLLNDYFSIDYNLLQDGDDLVKMSPGKRGIILFQIFLHLSKSENPILIDQPEDNLDNRTVYQELSDFIKTKKSTRQVIIVSHNPNLVVSTDSENVIVANQDGQNKSGNNAEFKFEYVNGSIEHSFVDEDKEGILLTRGIRQHVCDILEGGQEAFEKRENKYGFK